MKNRLFKQIDVFTSVPYLGNPLAVVLDGADLSTAQMQQFANWTNLSETTFLLPPTDATADYKVRIFTPQTELPFAGHPTIGTCHAWLQAGHTSKSPEVVVQECAVGLVRIRHDAHTHRLAYSAPHIERQAIASDFLRQLTHALGLSPADLVASQTLMSGEQHWFGLLIKDVKTLLDLQPDHAALKALNAKVGAVALTRSQTSEESAVDLEVRGFVAPSGINEDPVTGSLNGHLAQWLIADKFLPATYTAAQGQCLGRAGRIYLKRDSDNQVWVSGDAVTCVNGEVML